MSILNLFDEGTTTISQEFLPVGSRTSVPTLSQVLTAGDDGSALEITNVRYIQANYEVQVGNSAQTVAVLNLINSSTNSYQLVAYNNQLSVQQYNPNLAGTPLIFNSNGSVAICDAGKVAPKLYVNGTQGLSQVYDTLYNPPQAVTVTQPHYYNQLYVVPSQINLVPFVSTALSNTYFKLYALPIVNYPNCVHYVVNVSQIDFLFLNGSTTGTASMTMYLLDKTDLTSITQADLNKSTQAYAINPFTFTSGQEYNMNTAFTLEYQSDTVPPALQIVFACNTPGITINRYGFYGTLTADTIQYTTLAEVTV